MFAQLARQAGARVIERRENPGFGAANNLALRHVTQPVTVLLNPDTIDQRRVIPELARRAYERLCSRYGYQAESVRDALGELLSRRYKG